MKSSVKSGVSLIAVLLFMLAATTASIVVFRWLSQENFSSGARLKGSEAYQASQAGLEATKGWLMNKGADVGALLKVFEQNQGQKYIKLVSDVGTNAQYDLLAGKTFADDNKKKQKFEVYLTAAYTASQPYKLKFLSVGTARDGSKHSQAGIFEVDGLYKVIAYQPPTPTNAPEPPAFYGGMANNTQGKFSSAIINGDANVAGISTTGNLIVTGNLTTQNNREKRIGCKGSDGNKPADNERAGDMYVLGDVDIKEFTICGDAYVGGHLYAAGPTFRQNLYANGGVTNSGGNNVTVSGNLTLGGNYNLEDRDNIINGNLVMDYNRVYNANNASDGNFTTNNYQHGYFVIRDGSKIQAKGDVWSMKDLFNNSIANGNGKAEHDFTNLTLGYANKKLYIYKNTTTPKGKAQQCEQGQSECEKYTSGWIQETMDGKIAHFRTSGSQDVPTADNKPEGANLLDDMGTQIRDCPKKNGGTYKCIPDPLQIPKNKNNSNEPIWKAPAQKLTNLVSANDTANLPKACLRLVKPLTGNPSSGGNPGFGSHWCFGDGLNNVSNPTTADYPSMAGGYNFIKAANDCYAKLKQSDPEKILYPEDEQDASKKFLPITVKANADSREGYFDGNFIFYFPEDMNKEMKFPPTKDETKVFVYFEKGATGDIAWNNTCKDGYCKRNYFIFSEDDIAGTSGSGTLNGALFLANGAKVGGSGKLPDFTIDFNQELYQSLVDMGIVTGPGGTVVPPSGQNNIADIYHVPSTSHLKVKLESQYANEEALPQEKIINAKPAIMVLPRVIYLTPTDVAKQGFDIKKYYKVLYMNGATKPATENNPLDCSGFSQNSGVQTCKLTTNSSCGSSNDNTSLCKGHPFYVLVSTSSLGQGNNENGDGGNPGNPSETNVTLYCPGLGGSTEVQEGENVTAPTLTCSNTGAPPTSNVSWTSNNGPFSWGSSILPGTYSNIMGTANCGDKTGLTSNSCGNLTITSNTALTCNIASGTTVKAGNSISSGTPSIGSITLECSRGELNSVQYFNVGNNPDKLVAGTYNSVMVTAKCGLVDLQAQCDGTLNVVELTCDKKDLYAKPDATSITIGSQFSNLTCNTGSTITNLGLEYKSTSDQTYTNWDKTIPANAFVGLQYNIRGKAKCNNLDLTADCGTVTVAGITCGLPPTILVNGTIPQPTLTCNNGVSATNPSYKINSGTSSTTWSSPSTAVPEIYTIEGTANCGTASYLQTISYACPHVTVSAATGCQYTPSLCNGMQFSEVKKPASDYNTTNWTLTNWKGDAGALCLFATSITQMGNNTANQAIKVNGQVLPGKPGGSNPEGRCGGTGASWKTDNQLPCPEALAGIPTMDGGYYIYIPQGHYGQDFNVTGGTPSGNCSSTDVVCEYNPAYCGNKPFAEVVNGTTTKPTTAGACVFIKDFPEPTPGSCGIQPNLNSTISINGVELACGAIWDNCPCNSKPASKDGGYYVYLKSGTVNHWNNVTAGTKPTNCGSSSTITCSLSLTQGEQNLAIIPTVTCPSGTLGNRTFTASSGASSSRDNHCTSGIKDGVIFDDYSSTCNGCTTSSCCTGAQRTIYLNSVECGGVLQDLTANPINCGAVFILPNNRDKPAATCSSTSSTTISCSFSSNPLNVVLEQDIPAPTITCANSQTPSGKAFYSTSYLPNNYSLWTNGNPAKYASSQTAAVGNNPITASASCGSSTVTNSPVSCGTINVANSHVQATNCNNYIGTLPANPNPPTDPYTACFKHTNGTCYVCKIASETSNATCASTWVWQGDGDINNNISSGYWYQSVICPAGATGTCDASNAEQTNTGELNATTGKCWKITCSNKTLELGNWSSQIKLKLTGACEKANYTLDPGTGDEGWKAVCTNVNGEVYIEVLEGSTNSNFKADCW